MNNQIRQIINVAVVLLVLIGLGAGSSYIASLSPKASTTQKQSQQTVKSISYQGQDNKNVLELLKESHQVETVNSDYGTFVRSIDGVSQAENSFWVFYIDGEAGLEAADKTITKNGQSIEWRYESF